MPPIKNLSTTLDSFGLIFDDNNDFVMNIVRRSNSYCERKVENLILNQNSEGERLYNNYVDECIIGKKSIWEEVFMLETSSLFTSCN